MNRFISLLALALFFAVMAAPPAAADDQATCAGKDIPSGIAACTRLISAGGKAETLVSLYNDRAFHYFNSKDFDKAIADYSEAIRLNPKFAVVYSNRAIAHQAKGDHDRTIADMTEALRLEPNKFADRYFARGMAFSAKGEHGRAIADYSTAIKIDPKDTGALLNRASAYNQNNEPKKALADYRRLVALEPGNRDAAKAIVDIEAQLGVKAASNNQASGGGATADDRKVCSGKDIAAGIAACTRLISAGAAKGADLASLHNQRGFHHSSSRDRDSAIADYSEAIKLNPSSAVFYSNRAIAYQAKGDHDRTIADMNEALRLEPNKFSGRYVARGMALAAKGELGRAISDFDKALQLDPKSSAVHVQRALAHEKAGNRDKALADYQAAAKLDTTNKFAADAIVRLQPAGDKGQQASAAVQSAPISNIFGPRVALVIGNGKYQHATVLPNPANDAADVAASLRKLGFEVIEGRDLDKRGMEGKVREFSRKLDGAKLALFFYAGHGMQVGGRNYLVPVDARLERPGDLSFETIDVTQVVAQMEAEQRVNLIFLDACRDNPLSRSFARTLGTRSSAVGQGLASIQSTVGTMIAYATQPDAVALDGTGRNSPFTTALLKHVNTRGLEIGSMMRRVRAEVVQVTNGKQVPWDHSSLLGDVVLVQ